jgi:cell wall-associated NlpC family hydrolase
MNSSGKPLIVLLGALVIVTLLVFLALSGVAATFAWMAGGGYGSGPLLCQIVIPETTPSTSATTSTSGANTSACVKADQIGAQVVALAQTMAGSLYVNPACGGRISFPDCYYTWYKAPGSTFPPGMPTFPQSVIQYGEQVCPDCSAWANGTYQCVSFVRGAYSQVYPMRLSANAFDLWAVYATQPGWREIPSAAALPGQRSIPMPGDVMIFKDASIGHAAIVMSVELPTSSTIGAITFSNANSVSPYTTMPLLPDLTVDTAIWPGYSVWGYIRPSSGVASAQPAPPTSQESL